MTTSDQHKSDKSISLSSEKNVDWASIIKQWKISSMPQTAYCKENDINYNQFVYQVSKISARAKANPKLLPLKVTPPDNVIPVQNNFMLYYPSGLKLQIPINVHPDAIKALLNCIES